MSKLSVSDVERRSGLEKRSDETVGEYLTRVGERADLPPATVRSVVDHVNRERFGPASSGPEGSSAPVEEYLSAIDSIDSGADPDDTEDEPEPSTDPGDPAENPSSDRVTPASGQLGKPPEDDGGGVSKLVLLLLAVVLLGGLVAGGAALLTGDVLPGTEDAPGDDGTGDTETDDTGDTETDDTGDTETDDTDEAGDDREPIDIGSDDDADEEGVDPATFPDGFVLTL